MLKSTVTAIFCPPRAVSSNIAAFRHISMAKNKLHQEISRANWPTAVIMPKPSLNSINAKKNKSAVSIRRKSSMAHNSNKKTTGCGVSNTKPPPQCKTLPKPNCPKYCYPDCGKVAKSPPKCEKYVEPITCKRIKPPNPSFADCFQLTPRKERMY